MRESGEAFVRSLGITEGLKVLDLGCGDGTTALPAARLARTCWASTSRRTSLKPEISGLGMRASPTAGFRKAMRPTCMN
jgi:hypothetical protein